MKIEFNSNQTRVGKPEVKSLAVFRPAVRQVVGVTVRVQSIYHEALPHIASPIDSRSVICEVGVVDVVPVSPGKLLLVRLLLLF